MFDPQIRVYFKGMSRDSLRRGRQLTLDFLCCSLGGPALYLGRNMKTLHEGVGISGDDWTILPGHARTALNDLAVAQREKSDVLAFLEGLKSDVVEADGAHAL
jgi:hemoglobin